MLFRQKTKIITVWILFLVLAVGFLVGINLESVLLNNKNLSVESVEKETDVSEDQISKVTEKVLPAEGFTLPFSWEDIGPRLISWGVIDEKKFREIIKLSSQEEEVLTKGSDTPVKIGYENSQFVVDMLWAFGLAQKSIVYNEGPMGTDYKKDVANFASTGGWTLSKGNAVSHLNKHDLVLLTPEAQKRVAEIAKNIYRPCCGNSTYFPDCNHGMAALAAIEIMVAKGLSNEEIYKNVLKLNSFWFPQTYLTTALYFQKEGVNWDKIDAKLVLGQDFSSAKGAAEIAKKVGPLPGQNSGGGSCGA